MRQHVAEGIHQIEDAYTNWFLVEDDGAMTVVDTGFPRSWNSLHEALGELGRPASDIQAVVQTHCHFDHMGFADRARRELGVPVWVHHEEVAVARHPWRYDHERSRIPYALRHPTFDKIFAAMGLAGALWVKGTDDVRTYGSGELIDVPGLPHAVFTPGHTYGHCSLHFPERGALIAGDAIVTLDPYTGRTGPRIVAGAATADSAMALRSLDAVAATGAQTVLPGHGEPWTGGAAEAAERARAAGPA
jgi:glyoxylase-like metal-dependent hydrolase (beta-lactamase superfamily II)